MSHSKHTRRGHSLYIEKWDRSAKKYIHICKLCGFTGYSPVLALPQYENSVIRRELMQMMPELALDEQGRCAQCAAAMNRYDNTHNGGVT